MRTLTTLILAGLFVPVGGWAEQPSTPSAMTLAQTLDIAKERNPDILAAHDEWKMAEVKIPSVRTWPDPEVGVEYWGFPKSSLNVSQAPEKWYDVSQTIPFPGKLTLRGKAATHEARREEEVYRATERDILTQVKEAYYTLMYAERAVEIFNENVGIMRRFARTAESKYSVGKTPQSDVLRAQVELSKMENMAITTAQEQETAQAKLNALLDRRPEEPISAQEEPPLASIDLSFDELEKMALENRPEVHAASHHVNHMKAELAAMKADYLPDTMIQYTRRQVEGREADAIAMFKFNLPFVWYGRQRALVRSTTFEKDHADAMLRSAQTMTRYDVKEFLVNVQTSRRLVDLYKTTVLPQAEESVKVTEKAYESDRIGFFELLDSERALVDFQLEYQKSLSDYGTNLAHLERVVGLDFITGHEMPSAEGTKDHHHE